MNTPLTQLHQDWQTLRQGFANTDDKLLPQLSPVGLIITPYTFSSAQDVKAWLDDCSGLQGGWVQGASTLDYATDGLPAWPEYPLAGEWYGHVLSTQLHYRDQQWHLTVIEESSNGQADYLAEDLQQLGRHLDQAELTLHYRRYWALGAPSEQRPHIACARLKQLEKH